MYEEIFMKNLKQNKGIIIVALLILTFAGGFLAGNACLQHHLESKVQAKVKKNTSTNALTTTNGETNQAYDIAKNESPVVEEATKKAHAQAVTETSIAFAEDIIKNMSDAPLLEENAIPDENGMTYGDSSLESWINDVNATKGARNVIIRICEDAGIDATTAKVSDLTVQQIAQIDQEVFQNSKHGK